MTLPDYQSLKILVLIPWLVCHQSWCTYFWQPFAQAPHPAGHACSWVESRSHWGDIWEAAALPMALLWVGYNRLWNSSDRTLICLSCLMTIWLIIGYCWNSGENMCNQERYTGKLCPLWLPHRISTLSGAGNSLSLESTATLCCIRG